MGLVSHSLEPVEVTVLCGGHRHRIQYADGKLRLLDHTKKEIKRYSTYSALSSNEGPCRCVGVLRDWRDCVKGMGTPPQMRRLPERLLFVVKELRAEQFDSPTRDLPLHSMYGQKLTIRDLMDNVGLRDTKLHIASSILRLALTRFLRSHGKHWGSFSVFVRLYGNTPSRDQPRRGDVPQYEGTIVVQPPRWSYFPSSATFVLYGADDASFIPRPPVPVVIGDVLILKPEKVGPNMWSVWAFKLVDLLRRTVSVHPARRATLIKRESGFALVWRAPSREVIYD